MIGKRAIRGRRAGLTLVELLVVISIMTLMAALAIPVLRPLLESRRIREPARQVNNFLSAARTRAQAIGRPCGVLLERDKNLPQACVVLRQVEVPPPYAGDTDTAVVSVALQGVNAGVATLTITPNSSTFSTGLVRRGDLIQLNHQGYWYVISGGTLDAGGFIDPSAAFVAEANIGTGLVPWSATPTSLSFSILRRPQPTSAPPLLLPPRVAVDLFYSGFDQAPAAVQFAAGVNNGSVALMFSPDGSLQQAYWGAASSDVIMSAYLLVGLRDRVEANPAAASGLANSPAEDGLDNLQDLNNLWVVVSSQTGLVDTTAVANTGSPPNLFNARKFARDFGNTQGR